MPVSKEQLLPLTGFRFFLALWVIAFHRGDFAESLSTVPPSLRQVLGTGYVAVDVFFLLSGFVLAYNYSLDRPWSALQVRKFGIARFARIYPAYCAGLLLWAPRVIADLARHFSVANAAKQTAVAALNFGLLQAWLPQTARSWNSPGWSLSNEAFFYCCFPFVGVLLWRISGTWKLLAVGTLIWILSLTAPLIYVFGERLGLPAIQGPNQVLWETFVRYNPLLRLPSFCLGILVARAYLGLRASNSTLLGRGYWLYVPSLFLEVLVLASSSSVPPVLLNNGLLLPLHVCVILGLAMGGGIAARILALPAMVFLGNVSYSMYILHSPVSGWMNHLTSALLGRELGGLDLTALYLLVVIGLSSLVYKLLEEPANHALKRRLTARSQPTQERAA